MRLDNANFISKNEAATKRPLYAVQISIDFANTNTFWLTSSSLCEVPSGATVIHSVLSDISGTTQKLDPINAVASIGSINFKAVDNLQAVTNIIKTNLDAGSGLRHKRIRVYVGYDGLAWADYALVQTQIIKDVSLDDIVYGFSCSDVQRTARKIIFDNKETNLKYDIDDTQTAFVVYNTTDFDTVFHGTSYTDSPSTTVGYIKTEKEIIRWLSKVETPISKTGTDLSFSGSIISSSSTDLSVFADKQIIVIAGSTSNDGTYFINGSPTSTSLTVTGTFTTETAGASINILAEIQFYNVTRGSLNTKAILHSVDSTADSDKRTEVTEHIYLEIPAVKLLYAILTGTLYGDSATLPDHWHLNISTDYVATSTYTGIGVDWWDTTDDLAGFPSRFNGLEKIDGKTFYEKELLLLLGAYLPVLSDGQLALRRMNRTLADSPYVAILDNTNVVNHGNLTHDMGAVHNQFRIKWNWDVTKEKLTRSYLLVDAGSISVHGASDILQMKFRGLDGTNHTQATLAVRTDSARDRYTGPPLITEVECLHNMNKYEVGDVVRDQVPGIKDFVTGADINRSMEIQQARINWITGQVVFSLFGSSRAADAQSATALTTVLNDSFYGSGSGGTDISTVTTGSDIGGVWHISTNSTLTGGTDMTAAGSIFYYEGGIQLDVDKTLTINNNVQIRARDGFVCNGSIDGVGNGIVASTNGTAGMFNTKSTGGMDGILYEGYAEYISNERDTVQGSPLNYYTLDNGSTTLVGIPTELRGTSGADGGDMVGTYHPDHDSEGSPAGDPATATANGGAGGNSGAGLCVIGRGFSCGVSAVIDLGGDDGNTGDAGLYVGSVIVHPGSGGGGAPGGLLILLDGATSNESGVAAAFTANNGDINDIGVRHLNPLDNIGGIAGKYIYKRNVHSYYEGFYQQDLGQAAYRVQYIPADETPQVDVPEETSVAASITIQEVSTSVSNINSTSLEINVTPPSDGNYYSSRIMVAIQGTDGWFDLGIVLSTDEVVFPNATPGTIYEIRAFPISITKEQSEDYISDTHTVSSTIESVIGTGNALVTQTAPATNGGVVVDTDGIDAFDSGGDQTFDLNAATGRLTAGDTASDQYVDFNPATGIFEFGRDVVLRGTDAINNDNIYINNDRVDSSNYLNDTGSGGSVGSPSVSGDILLDSGTTSGGYAETVFKLSTLQPNTLDWSKIRHWKTRLAFSTLGGVAVMGMGDPDLANNNNKVVFKVDTSNNLWGITADGTGQASVDLSTTVAASGTVLLEIVVDKVGATANFYVNGVYKGQITTNLPSSSVSNTDLSSLRVEESGGAAVVLSYASFKFLQEE